MRIHRLCTTIASTLLVITCGFAPMATAAVDYTDIWWRAGGTESGWGVNLVHTGDVMFATFFIYGPTGAPVWYAADMKRTTGDTFAGPMYIVSGTWFGAPVFPPVTAANVVTVGTATFTASSSFGGTLSYTINAVTVNKNIERQNLAVPALADVYLSTMSRTYSGTCPTGTPASTLDVLWLVVQQSPKDPLHPELPTVDLGFFTTASTPVQFCAMRGDAVLRGKIFSASGAAYACTTGLNTTPTSTLEIESLRKLDNGIEAHWRQNYGACTETGRLTGIKQ